MKSEIIPIQQLEISKEEVSFWKKEVLASFKRQKDEFIARIGYEELIRYFEALQIASGSDINQLAIVDEFSPAILSVITATYYQNPDVSTEAKNPTADGNVQPSLQYLLQHPDFRPFRLTDLLKSSLRYGMDHVGMKEEMQLADFDLMVAGFCAVEMNKACSSAEENPVFDGTEESTYDKIVGGIKSLAKKFGMGKSSDEVEEEVAKEQPQEERIDFTDSTYCKRWNPLDVIFDSRANVFKESRFVGKVVRKSVADFNLLYPKFKGKLNAASGSFDNIEYSAHVLKENKKAITLIELEIKTKGPRNKVLVLANGIDEAIDYYEKPIITNNFSIKYGSVDKYGKIYPMSRARKAKKPQDDINHYMTIQFEHVDRAMRKIAVFMDGLTESGKTAQRSSDIYAVVEKSTPQSVYEAMPAPSVVPENKEIVMIMKESINKSVGTSELAKSGKSDNELLGQDQLQKQAFDVNVSAVQDALQDVADQLCDELKDIQQQTWDGEDFFKVTGIQGGDQWYTPEMGPLADILVGDYQVKTNIASAARPNPVKDRRDALEYSGWITSPQTLQFAAMHGKRPSMEALRNVAKQFNQNPDMSFEDLPLPPPMAPPNIVPVPGNAQNHPMREPVNASL